MNLETLQVIAILCSNQYPGYQETCSKKMIRCVNDKVVASLKVNQKPEEGTLLARCVLERE